jgi:glycosyltransferase involved in cell wall biosynthesis
MSTVEEVEVSHDQPVMRPKLLHITTVPMSLTFFRGQVGYMKERGLDVHALSSPGPDLDAFGVREGVPVSAVEMSRRITPLRDLLAIGKLVREMVRTRPTIVHAHTPKGGLLGMIAAYIYGAPVRIYHMRGLPLMGATGSRRRMLWLSEWLSCRLAGSVLCVSHSVRETAVEERICPPSKIKVLCGGSGNGVDSGGRFDPDSQDLEARREVRRKFGIPADAVVVGFVGRLVRDKGIVELVQAWSSLRDRYPAMHLLLVGPLEPQDPVPGDTEMVLREDPRIHLAGMDWNTPPLYAAMDVVALPTYREGFPNVPLEAAAMGLPVVATRIPGCIEAVADGETGILVAARNSQDLARAVAGYLDDPTLRRAHGHAGRERVRREFRQEAIWEALLGEYRHCLSIAGIPHPSIVPLENAGTVASTA